MKKILTILCVAAFLGGTTTSCKKEYECSCTDVSGTYTETAKGKSAEDACSDASSVLLLKTCVPA